MTYNDESYLSDLDIEGKRNFTALATGTYGTSQEPGLRITKFTGVKKDKNGSDRYSWRVVAINGAAGSAFAVVTLKPWHTTPEAMKLAGFKLPDEAVNQKTLSVLREKLAEEALEKVEAANTPDDKVDEAVKKAVENELTTVRINVGTILRLQDWSRLERTVAGWQPEAFVGTEFSGTIEPGIKPTAADVKSVFSKNKPAQGGCA